MVEPGHLLDGKMDVHPLLENFGAECLDKFDAVQNNIKFKPQYDDHGVLVPWMLGVPNRNIAAGEEFGFAYGADHWRNKFHFSTLSKAQQTLCLKYYNFKEKDIVKQGTPDEPLSTPPKHRGEQAAPISNGRSSPARQSRAPKK